VRRINLWICFTFSLLVFAMIPLVVRAQEGAPPIDVSNFVSAETMVTIAFWIGVALALVEVAKRVCARIPGERDDQITNWVSYVLRWILDLVAGKTGKPSDPSLIKRE